MQLIVLGMHRSGTSGVTRLLNMAGAYFGPEGIATDANDENPKGFWERRDLRAACDGLLQESGFDWWRVHGFDIDAIPEEVRESRLADLRRIVTDLDAHRPWVLKEPRLCLLFPLLRPLLEVPVCIHVSREPLEVAGSVHARNGFPIQVGLALWEFYTVRAIEASAGLPRITVRYEDLMAEPVGTVEQLLTQLEELGVQGLRVPTEREITAFIVPELHRVRASSRVRPVRMNAWQVKLAKHLDAGTSLDSWTRTDVSEGALDTLALFESDEDRRVAVEGLEETVTTLRHEHTEQVTELERRIREQDRERAEHERELEQTRAQVDEQRGVAAAAHEEAQRFAEALRSERDRVAAANEEVQLLAERRLRDDAVRIQPALAALDATTSQLRKLAGSRSWRTASNAMSLRQRLQPGLSVPKRSPVERALGSVEEARRALSRPVGEDADAPASLGEGAPTPRSALSAPTPGPSTTGRSGSRSWRPKIAVVAWDVGHNPLGRAYVMAEMASRHFDVEIWGAQFERYGSRVWAPLRNSTVPIHAFAGKPFPDHLTTMQEVAQRIDADAIWVSKPRLPSFALGALAKEARNRPVVLDVDDRELAFFDEEEGLDIRSFEEAGDLDLSLPFERAWTRGCEPLIGAADAVTVSNTALADLFGGTIVPHARDETVFDPRRYDRDLVRARLGVTSSDRLLLFGGTPRIHKGIVEVLTAVDRLGDERYRVALFGTRELASLREHIGDLERWILPLPYQPFDQLAPLVGAADLACVLHDPTHPVPRHQLPAKVFDALAMEVPCLVSPSEPLRTLIDEDVLQVHEHGEPLDERIAEIFDERDDALERARKGRKVFLESYSYEAVGERIRPVFEELIADPPSMSAGMQTLIDVPRKLYAERTTVNPAVQPRTPGSRTRTVRPGEPYDLVVFWRQNDTSIYGRRQDMLLKYLEQSGRFHTIVHFDQPTTPESLYKLYRSGTDRTDQARLVVRQTMRRVARRNDRGRVHQHTFLHAGKYSARLRLPKRSRHVDYVRSVLRKHGVGERPTVFLVYPRHDDFPAIADALRPDVIVADVVDDNRTWYERDSLQWERVDRNYEEILSRSDIVLANCEPVARSMEDFAPEIHVVPNGCELPDGGPRGPRPPELRGLSGPIIGYVGNLSSRIDLDLLDTIARSHPDWNLVLIGSAHLDQSILRLDSRPNVHFLGVKPYEETKHLVEHFDVALIPHLDNEMTRSMNPLKAFVYCAAGVPVVSTPIAGLDELAAAITIASGTDEFVAAIERHLAEGRREPDLDLLTPHAWTGRVDEILGFIDTSMGVTDETVDSRR